MKRVSDDEKIVEFDFLGQSNPLSLNVIKVEDVRISQYLSKYEDKYWIGMASEIDRKAKDVKIKFMHPHFSSIS